MVDNTYRSIDRINNEIDALAQKMKVLRERYATESELAQSNEWKELVGESKKIMDQVNSTFETQSQYIEDIRIASRAARKQVDLRHKSYRRKRVPPLITTIIIFLLMAAIFIGMQSE